MCSILVTVGTFVRGNHTNGRSPTSLRSCQAGRAITVAPSLLFYPAPDTRDNLLAIRRFTAGVVDPEPGLR